VKRGFSEFVTSRRRATVIVIAIAIAMSILSCVHCCVQLGWRADVVELDELAKVDSANLLEVRTRPSRYSDTILLHTTTTSDVQKQRMKLVLMAFRKTSSTENYGHRNS
jgi:hypothetical protein